MRGPRRTLAYARRFLVAEEPRHLGHNPLGACMILTLLACVGGLALTGWLYTTDRFWGDETVEQVHVALAWTMLGLVSCTSRESRWRAFGIARTWSRRCSAGTKEHRERAT